MRRVLPVFAAMALFAAAGSPTPAEAQSSQRQQGRGQQQQAQQEQRPQRQPRIAPLQRRPNAGPCPYVKILYDAARYVELEDGRPAYGAVGYTGEIEGLTSSCAYRGEEPIRVDMDVLFRLGRGPQATGAQRTYRYWIAVTERNRAVLDKQYFDLPVNFGGAQTAEATEQRTIVIPRAQMTTSGAAFEILVGFDVTPEMAEFNRGGSRFRPQTSDAPNP